MCGRYYFAIKSIPVDSALFQHGLEPSLFSYAHGEIFPSEKAIVLVQDDEDYHVEVMQWGLSAFKKRVINARLESLAEKKLYANMLTKRCLIPCNGYYEWKKDDNGSHKCFIHKQNETTFYLAGLYNNQHEFVILTRPAHSDLAKIHHRMPIMIDYAHILPYLHNAENIITNARGLMIHGDCL